MASGLVGTAFVKVTPDTSGFGSQLAGQMPGPAQQAGRTLTQRLTGTIATGLRGAGGLISSGFNTAFTTASAMASNTGSRIARGIGTATLGVLGPIGRMRDGFVSSAVAGSRFSGLSGTIGGKLRQAVNVVGAGAGRIGGMFRRSGGEAAAATARMSSGLGGVTRMLGAIGGITAIATLGKQAFQSAAGIQQSQAALTGLYGNAQQATDMIGRLRKMAAGSPIEFAAFRQGAESLAYMGYSGDQATGVLNNVARALVGAGKGSEAMNQVTEAMLNMQNQGKATAEDVNRISQAGIPAWEALATNAGMSIEEVRKATEKGEMSIEDMVAAIQSASGPTFDKLLAASDNASGTFTNTWARVKDNVITSLGEMMTGLLTRFGPALERLGTALSAAMSALPGILSQVGTFLSPLVGVFTNLWAAAQPFLQGFGMGFVGALMAIGQATQSVVGPALTWLSGLFRGLVGSNTTLVQILGIVAGALVALVGTVKTVTMVINGVSGAMRLLNVAFTASPVGLLLVGLTALVGGFILLWNKSAAFRDFFIGMWEAIKGATMAVWNFLSGFITGAWNGIVAVGRGVWNGLAAFFTGLWNGIRSVIVGAWNAIGSFLSGAWNGIVTGARNAFTAVLNFFRNLPGNILNAIGNLGWLLFGAGIDLLKGLWNGISNAAGWLLQQVGNFFGNLLPGWVRDMLGIGSPSTVFARFGKDTMRGFAKGIDDQGDHAVRAAQDIADRVSSVEAEMDARMNLDTNTLTPPDLMEQAVTGRPGAAGRSLYQQILDALSNWKIEQDASGQFKLVSNQAVAFARR